MALDKSQICDEVKGSLEKFNKLLEQSEQYANQFYEQMEKFNSKKDNESEITSGNQKEISKENDAGKNSDLIEELESEITARNTKVKSMSLKRNETIEEMESRMEAERADRFKKTEAGEVCSFKSKIQRFNSMRMSNSTNKFNFGKNAPPVSRKPKCFIKGVSDVSPLGNIKIYNLDKENYVSPDTVMKKSTMDNKSESQDPKMFKSRNETNTILKEYKEKNMQLKEKSKHVESKLSSENCQIFIYGQVSAGKSKIINAILGGEIFQSTVAHTTSCFVKICKSFDQHHHIEYGNNKETCKTLDDLKNKVKSMSTEFATDKYKLKTNELLSVYLNIPDNKILTSKTEIMDCPGTANKYAITKNLKNQALEAHIFIFVLNNGITDDDKTFFEEQLEQSSSPTIFMLVNKWDLAYVDGAETAEQCKTAITKDLMSFLKNKLHVSENDANHIFFVSAEDMYIKRNIKKRNAEKTCGYDDRCRQFEEFEDTLSKFINTFNANKLNHYKEELDIITINITEYMERFKTDFLPKCYFKDILVEWPNYKCELQKSLHEQISYIRNAHDELKEKSNAFLDECVNSLNRDNISEMNSKYDILIEKGKNYFLESKNNVNAFIEEKNKNYRKLSSIEKEKGDFSFKEMMKMEIQLQKIDDTAWEKFCRKFTEIFKILQNNFQRNLRVKDADILKKNLEEAKTSLAEFKNHASEYFYMLSEYLKNEINVIIDEMDNKIKLCTEYLTNIENLFQLKVKC